jgi:hypothetical protein
MCRGGNSDTDAADAKTSVALDEWKAGVLKSAPDYSRKDLAAVDPWDTGPRETECHCKDINHGCCGIATGGDICRDTFAGYYRRADLNVGAKEIHRKSLEGYLF